MKISVVIPVHNAAPWLRECLQSVIAAAESLSRAERGEQVEIICVDDGSTDGSSEILEEFFRHCSPSPAFFTCKILHQQNLGVSGARNMALDLAQGEWIAFVDADDTVESDWFVNLLAHATDETDWVHVDSQWCFDGSARSLEDRTYRTFLKFGWSVLNLVRRSLVGQTRYRVGMRFKEDVIFFAELSRKNPRISWVKVRGYNYRRHEESAVARRVSDEDSVRFCSEVQNLGLPREDAGMTIGYDLIQWIRDVPLDYDAAKCQVLAFWRRGIAEGSLKVGDVRWWWRPGLRHWLKTGKVDWLVWTRKIRLKLEGWTRGESW